MKKAFIKLHIAILLAGFTGIFGKLITLNEGLLTWYRMCIAGLFLVIIVGMNKKLVPISWREFGRFAWVGFLLGLHWLLFYGSIKYSNISVGVVCFALAGFFTAVFAPLINRHKFAIAELLLSLLTLAGIILIFSFDSRYRVGVGLGVVSSMIGALYTINNERLAQSYKSEVIMVYSMVGGTMSLTLVMPFYLYFLPVKSLLPSGADWGYLIILALFCTVLLYMLQTQALNRISAFTVNLSLNLEPVYTIILAVLIYQENKELTSAFYLGLGLIILSVILQMVRVVIENRKIHAVPG